jgi:hypothetical protein
LAYQGLEIASHGRLTLPMPEPERERVLQVKRGDVTELGDVLREIDKVEVEIEALLAAGRTPLPADPDLEGISDWSTNAHRVHWGWT